MTALSLGAHAPDFTLPDARGNAVSLHDHWHGRATVVCFTCNHCPYAQAWEDRLVSFAAACAQRGVGMVAINANATQRERGESAAAMAERAASKSFPFPYLLDDRQDVARPYGATRTPELFIFDGEHCLRYHGAIDDNYDDPDAVTQRFADDAIAAILAGGLPDVAETPPLGCSIRFAPATATASPLPPQPDAVAATSPVQPQRLIYYSLTDCPTCVEAKAAMRERGIAFEERIVDDDELWQQEVFRLTGQTTVPVFVRDGVVEVGFEGEPGCHF